MMRLIFCIIVALLVGYLAPRSEAAGPTWTFRECWSPEEVAKVLGEMSESQVTSAKIEHTGDGPWYIFFRRTK